MDVIRDPLWNNIRVDDVALRLIDTATFQRLRYVRQLGLAYLVYPGATHTRFEHALGAYHLARRTLALLAERGELARIESSEGAIITAAALVYVAAIWFWRTRYTTRAVLDQIAGGAMATMDVFASRVPPAL